MRVTRRIVWDMTDAMRVLEHEYFEYDGEVAQLKYDDSKQAAEKEQASNDAAKAAALQQQQSFSQPLHTGLDKYLKGDVGFTPEQLALLNSFTENQNSQQFNSAGQDVRAALESRGSGGGDQPVGGDYTRGIATLSGLKGASLADALRSNRLSDIQQGLANKFNAANIFAGESGIYGNQAVGFGGLANQNVSQIHQAFRPGFAETLGDSLAKALPQAGLALATGGLSGVLSGAGAAAGATSGAASVPGFFSGGQR